jgi:hypothetical protein
VLLPLGWVNNFWIKFPGTLRRHRAGEAEGEGEQTGEREGAGARAQAVCVVA